MPPVPPTISIISPSSYNRYTPHGYTTQALTSQCHTPSPRKQMETQHVTQRSDETTKPVSTSRNNFEQLKVSLKDEEKGGAQEVRGAAELGATHATHATDTLSQALSLQNLDGDIVTVNHAVQTLFKALPSLQATGPRRVFAHSVTVLLFIASYGTLTMSCAVLGYCHCIEYIDVSKTLTSRL